MVDVDNIGDGKYAAIEQSINKDTIEVGLPTFYGSNANIGKCIRKKMCGEYFQG